MDASAATAVEGTSFGIPARTAMASTPVNEHYVRVFSLRAARGLGEEIGGVGRERAPDLDVKTGIGAPPQNDLASGADGAGRHADRETPPGRGREDSPPFSARAARAPSTSRPIWRCETSTRLWGRPASAASSAGASRAASSPGAIMSHSSGPSQIEARVPALTARHGVIGGEAPKAAPARVAASASPRSTKRAASGASRMAKDRLAGSSRSASGRRRASGPRTDELAIEPRPFLVEERHLDRGDRERHAGGRACRPRKSGGPEAAWIPAFAGMTRCFRARNNGISRQGACGPIRSARRRSSARAPGSNRLKSHGRAHGAPRGGLAVAVICAPSSSTTLGSSVSSPTSCLRFAATMSGRASERLPTKSFFALPIAHSRPSVVRRHRAVGLLADDDVALLGAQHVHRLGAVGDAP